MTLPNIVAARAQAVPEKLCTSTEEFFDTIQGQNEPVVIRSAVRHWPAVQEGRYSPERMANLVLPHSKEHPIEVLEGAPHGRFFYSDDLTDFNFTRTKTSLSALFERLQSNRNAHYYAGAINIPAHMPGFLRDHQHPFLKNKQETLVSAWLGTRSRVPLHWDLPENLACVAAGRRAFTLLPTEQLPNVYIGPLDRTIAGQPCSLVDFHNIDQTRFPRFEQALQHALYAELEPGDVIYIPSMWMHHVESLDDFGMLVNFWWREGPPHLITPMSTLMHGLLSLRGMPKPEREAWKVLFDHYLFGDQEAALDHIPHPARGLWGEMSDETRQQLRRMLGTRLMQ